MNAPAEFLHAEQRNRASFSERTNGIEIGTTARLIGHNLGWHREDWSDFELTFRISGRIIVKKRSHIIVRMGPRVSIGYSSEYKKWEKAAAAEIARQWASAGMTAPMPAELRVNLKVVTYFANKSGIPDLSATLEGPQDVLEAHKHTCRENCVRHGGVLLNDKFVCGHVGSERLLDPEDPHTDLTLTPHRPTPNP